MQNDNVVHPTSQSLGMHIYQISAFISTCRHLLPSIKMGWRLQRHEDHLPMSVLGYLCSRLNMSFEDVSRCWDELSTEILNEMPLPFEELMPSPLTGATSIDTLISLKLPAMTMMLPFERCPNENCGRKLLAKPPINGSILTIKHGKVPILCPSLYCKVCKTRFYHNYYVTRASEKESKRVYYSLERPQFIEIQDHTFADREFCEWVRMEMALNNASSSNVAVMYERTLSGRWNTSTGGDEITGRTALEAFFLYSLLLDSEREGRRLELPHRESQSLRLSKALHERNARYASLGLLHWRHSCRNCFKKVIDEDTGESRRNCTKFS